MKRRLQIYLPASSSQVHEARASRMSPAFAGALQYSLRRHHIAEGRWQFSTSIEG